MNEQKFPFEEDILQLAPGQEFVVFIKGQPFIITPATDDEVERIGQGYYCMD